jgi:hypothetical protein
MSHLAVYTEEDVLTQLRILSFLNPSDRISTNGATIRVQKPSAFRGISRILSSDSRTSNAQYVRMLFKKVGEFYQLETSPPARERYQMEVRGAISGLRNLQLTYEDDSSFISAIDIVIETVSILMNLPVAEAPHRSAVTGQVPTSAPPPPHSSRQRTTNKPLSSKTAATARSDSGGSNSDTDSDP